MSSKSHIYDIETIQFKTVTNSVFQLQLFFVFLPFCRSIKRLSSEFVCNFFHLLSVSCIYSIYLCTAVFKHQFHWISLSPFEPKGEFSQQYLSRYTVSTDGSFAYANYLFSDSVENCLFFVFTRVAVGVTNYAAYYSVFLDFYFLVQFFILILVCACLNLTKINNNNEKKNFDLSLNKHNRSE